MGFFKRYLTLGKGDHTVVAISQHHLFTEIISSYKVMFISLFLRFTAKANRMKVITENWKKCTKDVLLQSVQKMIFS